MMEMGDFLPTFLTECKDNLHVYEDCLIELSQGGGDEETINTVFRAIHSIKGGAGMFDAEPLVGLAHVTESVLDLARSNQLVIDEALFDLFFSAKDALEKYIDELAEGSVQENETAKDLIVSLNAYLDNRSSNQSQTVASTSQLTQDKQDKNRLVIMLDKDALRFGFRLEPILMELSEIKKVEEKIIHYQGPQFQDLDPLTLNLELQFVVSPPITEDEVDELLSFSAGAEGRIETIAVEQVSSKTEQDNKKATDTPAQKTEVKDAGQVIKVNSLKLDQLVDDVGELISLRVQLYSALGNDSQDEMKRVVDEIGKSLNGLRDTALSLRLVPVGNTLQRFHRVVREAAKVTDKQIELEIKGASTELDRVTVEKLVDPLTHIIRNSCDHGIEQPHERLEKGKPEKGCILVEASYVGSGVSIRISDDGKGLAKERILIKALENGVVQEDERLTDHDIYQLIFHPGLSTAEKVTDLSGRGVGMDVVRKNINQLGGEILIDSAPNQGTVLDIRLPLTTAILNGFVVHCGDATLVFQMDHVCECIRQDELVRAKVTEEECLLLRGDYIPMIYLANMLHLKPKTEKPEAIIVRTQHGPIAIVVDILVGELETVVKPLDPILKQSHLFSGIVKLSSGDLGFVLDIHQIVQRAKQSVTQPF